MPHNENCEACMQNLLIQQQKKLKQSEKSKLYYRENRDEIILRNVKNYYSAKKKNK
jgi:hypothetical protein